MSQDTASATLTLRGLKALFDSTMKAATPFYPALAWETDSDGADEQYAMLGAVPAIREWLGDRDFKEMAASDWTITNGWYESSVQILRTDYDDDRLRLYVPQVQRMGIRQANHPNKLLATLINNGRTGLCFDGQFFFDSDHSWGDSGTQTNLVAQSVSDTTAITSAEVKTAFNAAMTAIAGFKDNAGELLNDDIQDITTQIAVMANPVLRQQLEDALSVKLNATGGDNVVLARPMIRTSSLLTSTTKIYVFKIDSPEKPFIFQRRSPIKTQIKGENDIEEKFIKFLTEARYAMAYGAWWQAVEVTFS